MFVDAICAGFSGGDSLAFAENLTNKVADKVKKLELILPEGWVFQGTLDVYEDRGRVKLNRKMPDGSISKNCHWCHYQYDSGYLSKLRARIKGVQQSVFAVIPKQVIVDIRAKLDVGNPADNKLIRAEMKKVATLMKKIQSKPGVQFVWFVEDNVTEKDIKASRVGLVRINAPRITTPPCGKFIASRLGQSGGLCALIALPVDVREPFAYCDMFDSMEVKTLLSRIDDWLQQHAQDK